MMKRYQSLLLLLVVATSSGQDYDYPEYQDYADNDYGQDNLYANYAAKSDQGGGGGGGG
jgi:hypothetical protein